MPELPRDRAITVVPDWVCEVLSPTTRRHNLRIKRPYHASVGVEWLWLADSEAMVVTVQRLHEGRWLDVGVFSDEAEARIPPFADVAVDVNGWWPEPGA